MPPQAIVICNQTLGIRLPFAYMIYNTGYSNLVVKFGRPDDGTLLVISAARQGNARLFTGGPSLAATALIGFKTLTPSCKLLYSQRTRRGPFGHRRTAGFCIRELDYSKFPSHLVIMPQSKLKMTEHLEYPRDYHFRLGSHILWRSAPALFL